MIHRRLTYHESMRVLLEGISGPKLNAISVETGVTRTTVRNFLTNKRTCHDDTIETIAWYIWKKMNSTVLLSDSDRQ